MSYSRSPRQPGFRVAYDLCRNFYPLLPILFSLMAEFTWGIPIANDVERSEKQHPVEAIDLLSNMRRSDWVQWRGPTRNGHVQDNPWPTTLSNGAIRRLWRVELDEGYPGPIISGDRVFTVETKDRTREVVRAIHRHTGKHLWETSWQGSLKVPGFARRNGSWVKATPACDGKQLYVPGMRDILVCLNAEDGNEIWRIDFTERFGTQLPAFGYVSSPIVDEDAVYVQAGMAVCKVEKQTGKSIWRTLEDRRSMFGSAFSSPIIDTFSGKRQLIVQTRMQLAGIDLETGDVLWDRPIKAFRGMNILTPIVFEDYIFTASYGGGTFMSKVIRNGEVFKVHPTWSLNIEGYMSSPVVIGEHLYLHRRNRRVSCINLKTGQEKWTSNRQFGEYWSMLANADLILALDQKGLLFLMRANPNRFEILDTLRIADSETWGHLAICGNTIFVRELTALAAYRWSVSGQTQACEVDF